MHADITQDLIDKVASVESAIDAMDKMKDAFVETAVLAFKNAWDAHPSLKWHEYDEATLRDRLHDTIIDTLADARDSLQDAIDDIIDSTPYVSDDDYFGTPRR